MKLEEFFSFVSTEKKRLVLRYIASGGEAGISIRKLNHKTYTVENLHKVVKDFVYAGIIEECGFTERSTTSTFPNTATLHRLTKEKGKKVMKMLDYVERGLI